MKPLDCEFEPDVLAAVVQSRWPDRVDPQLRAHAASCSICSETALVAGAIEEEREQTRTSAVLPDSGRVWWLAQLRARREAIEAAGRPITAVQVIAFACATGLLGACFGATSEWFQSALRWVALKWIALKWIASKPLTTLIAEHAFLAIAMAAVIVLVPAAAYFAMGKD